MKGVGMGIKLFHLGQLMTRGIDFSLVLGDVLILLRYSGMRSRSADITTP
jgi:hypothetical protein